MVRQYAIRLMGREITPRFELATWLWSVLIFTYFFLLGFPRLFTISAAILFVLGIVRLVAALREYGISGMPAAYRNFVGLFLCLWLPLLLSLTDARYMHEAAADTLKILAYFFVGFSCVWLARERNVAQPVVIFLTGLALFWALDVIFQRTVGFDVFGVDYVAHSEDRAGAYFKNAAKFGTYLACMSVIAMYYLAPRIRVATLALVVAIFAIGLVVSMTRTAWFIFIIFAAPVVLIYIVKPVRHAWLGLVIFLLIGAAAVYGLYEYDAVFHRRMQRSLAFMDGMTYDNWNTVLTYRLDLWSVSLKMISEHWLNGLGLNAFTVDFNSYTSSPYWSGVQPSHEHQYLLQVMNAAGLFGLLGILGVHVLLFRVWRRSAVRGAAAFPLMMYLFAMWFPLGSHFSFYSSEWVWANLMVLGLIVGSLDARPVQNRGSSLVSTL
ncbi:MAG: O-antigen ligase family protein [Moraxellaceae bacterium]